MGSPYTTESPVPAISWGRSLVLALVWIFVCVGCGFLVAEMNGEFGSLAFVGLGIWVGISGAIGHFALSRSSRFLKLPGAAQVLILVSTSELLLFAGLLGSIALSGGPSLTDIAFILTIALGFSIVGACITTWMQRQPYQ